MRRVLVILLLVALTSCANNDSPKSLPAPTSAAGPTTTTPFGDTPISTPQSSQGHLTKVTAGVHDNFTRIVFTFATAVPGYAIAAASPPFVQDGSGAAVAVRGDAFLSVRLLARAHDRDGKSTAPAALGSVSDTVEEVKRTGDFEGVVNYVVGMRQLRPFRTFTLAFPSRLVLDIAS